MSDTFSKVEVITGVARRRRFTTEQKLLVVNETLPAGHFKFLRVWSVKFLHPARQDMMIVSLTLFPGQGLQRPL